MILNISKIKTEALLLFCKDLINSYKDIEPASNTDKILHEEFKKINNEILVQLSFLTNDSKYYLNNQKNFKIKAILKCYSFLSNELSKNLKENEEFNPSMLYFSFLALWFKELNKESNSKEFIYFTLYPYSNIYDKFLVKVKDIQYKSINIKMIDLAEKIVYKYDSVSL
ncbi:hypothetical protein ACN2EN_01435 [Aliarcobacter lanthieri]|uniref:hypothetical protein n=1 Tax=Aliarcobacter lanthieri TaxID=1355374 RepID=UPI00047A2E7E|nr:hypothetical protein [Aliarcobacter lanthieri]QKF58333.1 hypothetical protein ALANTH_0194 [Aliarcobacter lanthieri]